MSLVHKHSQECTKSELDLFALPPTQVSLERGLWTEFRPVASITELGPLEFHIAGSAEEYTDLSESYLHLQVQIVRPDGTNLVADEQVGPVNNLLHSLISQVEVYLNGRLVSTVNNTYPYISMLQCLLSYGQDAANTHLGTSLYYKDTAGELDSLAPEGEFASNEGLKTRYQFTKESQTVELYGRLHSDLFQQDRLLLNQVDLTLKLTRSKNEFCLLSPVADSRYKVVIKDAAVYMRRCKISPAVLNAHSKALERSTAKYPIKRTDCKVFSIPRGNLSVTEDNIFQGQIPNRIVIGLVDNDAYNGSYRKNPFNFKHFGVNFLSLYLDGASIPGKPLQPNFNNAGGPRYIRAYQTLLSGTDVMCFDQGHQISRQEYPKGYTLYAFDLTPDLNSGDHFNLTKHGNLRIGLQFDIPLENTINMIVYAEFQNVVEIDRGRNIIFDYSH